MRGCWVILAVLIGCGTLDAFAGSPHIKKVLVHRLDDRGRHTEAPSLYERDAKQAELRQHPELVAGLRFDVHWKASRSSGRVLTLRIEIRGSAGGPPTVVDRQVLPGGWFGRWTSVKLSPAEFKRVGEVLAWRATLWHRNDLLAEQRSFLW